LASHNKQKLLRQAKIRSESNGPENTPAAEQQDQSKGKSSSKNIT
jgi:hypothetical protein